jgi:hypothetical protein
VKIKTRIIYGRGVKDENVLGGEVKDAIGLGA